MSILELMTSLELGLIYGIAAIGILLSFRIIDFPDLSCDGSFVLGAAASAMLLKIGCNPMLAILVGAIAGGLAGLCTGILHIYCKVSNLLSGILTAFMLYSINLKVMQGLPNIALIHVRTIFSVENPLFILIIISFIIVLSLGFFLATDFGLALRSLGQNRRLAINCGVRISSMTLVGLVLSNAFIGLSGSLFTQHQGFVDVSQGVGTIIIGLAAVIIGEKLLAARSVWLSVFACVLGSIVYRIIVAFALHSEWLGLETQDLNLLTGLLVVAIMSMPSFRMGRSHA